jgi:hypothetical protein
MKRKPKKTSIKAFVQEFELRQVFTPELFNLELKRAKDLKMARQMMLN